MKVQRKTELETFLGLQCFFVIGFMIGPFLGSGQVAVVSKSLKRRFIGFEIVPEYYKFAKKRLDKDLYRIKASK